jgi:serine/threonine-protein kinase RsbT
MAFTAIDRTKLVTAASEIGRNTLVHGKGGTMQMDELLDNGVAGLRLVFTDEGPGIADVAQAFTDGFSTARGLGLGLGGSQRLVNELAIHTEAGRGTTITLIQWKRR